MEWPLSRNEELEDSTVFDLVEFAATRIAFPIEGKWHDYWSHYELSFDEPEGQRAFLAEVNELLARGGTTFELSVGLKVERRGTPIVREVLKNLASDSGDLNLDQMLTEATTRYRSRHEVDRALALEKLWDAFERLKTIDVPGNKRASTAALLAHAHLDPDRQLLEDEMRALTNIGNSFMIRHHETDKNPVSAEMREYLFARLGALLVVLLRTSNRLA